MTQAQITNMVQALVNKGYVMVEALAIAMAFYKVEQLKAAGYDLKPEDMTIIAHNAKVLAEETLAKKEAA